MISSIQNTVSALKAHEKKMEVVANNVANVQTEGFSKSRADFKAGAGGSIDIEVNVVSNSAPPPISDENGFTMEIVMTNNVDLSEEIPQAMITEKGYEANVKVLKTEDEMVGTLLDMIG